LLYVKKVLKEIKKFRQREITSEEVGQRYEELLTLILSWQERLK